MSITNMPKLVSFSGRNISNVLSLHVSPRLQLPYGYVLPIIQGLWFRFTASVRELQAVGAPGVMGDLGAIGEFTENVLPCLCKTESLFRFKYFL